MSLVCLALIGPLRGVLSSFPLLLFLATFALFLTPGVILTQLFLSRHLPGMSAVPVAFTLGVGIFGLPSIPVLVLGWNLGTYIALCGGILAGSLILAAIGAFYRRPATEREASMEASSSTSPVNWLWAPFLGLGGVLAYTSAVKVHEADADTWVYMVYLQRFLYLDKLTGVGELGEFSNTVTNWWIAEQAAFSRVSGIEPVTLVLEYLAPALVFVALLAVYALARVLFKNETAALLAGSLSALLYLISLNSTDQTALLVSGTDFISRITEDKYIARFVFMPLALAPAVLFLRERRWRYLALFTFICWSVVAIHPLGLVFIGAPIVGFGVVYLAVNWRRWRSWAPLGAVGVAMLSIGLPPAVYLLVTGNPLLSKLGSTDDMLANSLLETWQNQGRLLAVGETYIANPSLLLNPAMLGAYLLGVPFLLWRVRRSLAAQLLLGTLLFVPVLIYVPPVAGYVGSKIGPWTLPRLFWPLPLAAGLVLAWVAWKVLEYLWRRLDGSRFRVLRIAGPLLPFLFVCALIAAATPLAVAQVKSADDSGETAQDQSDCLDPAFRWMQDEITTYSRVLAPSDENSCIQAYATPAEVLNIRGYVSPDAPPAVSGLQTALSAPTLDREAILNLLSQNIDYVLLPIDSPLNEQFRHMLAFTRMDNPGERYQLYKVDRKNLGITPAAEANSYLNQRDWGNAIDSYLAVTSDPQLQKNQDQQFLAYLGLGRAYMGSNQPGQAVDSYAAAAAIDPNIPTLYSSLADAYTATGDFNAARDALEQGVALAPQDTKLRSQLGTLLLNMQDKGAVDQFDDVVEAYPKVPEYHVNLGKALYQSGDSGAAREEFGRATDLNPLSFKVHADVGDAYLNLGSLEEASAEYEKATELNPSSQLFAFKLGTTYSALSTKNGLHEEYFDPAEENLKRAGELEPSPGGQDLRANALIALGDLYYAWDRKEDATGAYEDALKIDPNSEEAKNKLDKLKG